MSKVTTLERLAVIEEQLKQNAKEHEEVKKGIHEINEKLDTVINSKADKDDLTKLNNRLWGVAGSAAVIIIGIIVKLLIG